MCKHFIYKVLIFYITLLPSSVWIKPAKYSLNPTIGLPRCYKHICDISGNLRWTGSCYVHRVVIVHILLGLSI